jgi:hypothetical protein
MLRQELKSNLSSCYLLKTKYIKKLSYEKDRIKHKFKGNVSDVMKNQKRISGYAYKERMRFFEFCITVFEQI